MFLNKRIPSLPPFSVIPRRRKQGCYAHERRNFLSAWPVEKVHVNATSIRQTGSAVDEIFAEFDYNANGLMTSVKRYEVDGNNLINEIAESLYTYNANNAVTSITHKNPDETPAMTYTHH